MKNKDKTKRNEEIKKLSNTLTPQQIAKELSISIITVKKVLSSQLNEQVKDVKEIPDTKYIGAIELIKRLNDNTKLKKEQPKETIAIANMKVENSLELKPVYSKEEVDNLITNLDKKFEDYFLNLQEKLDDLSLNPTEKSDCGFPHDLLVLKDMPNLNKYQVKDILTCAITTLMPKMFTLNMLFPRLKLFKYLTEEMIIGGMENIECIYKKKDNYIKI